MGKHGFLVKPCILVNCRLWTCFRAFFCGVLFRFSGTSGGNSAGNSGDARNLLGVMRTGLFAGGLMLAGESNVQLVLLTAEKPTTTLLHSIVEQLSNELPVRMPVLWSLVWGFSCW